jgi:cytochrome b561
MQYNKVAKLLHWTMSGLIVFLLVLGLSLDSLENKSFFYPLHKSFGLLALFLVTIRLIWRITHTYPSLPKGTPSLLAFLAKITILGLYFLMFFMPITGLLLSNSFGMPASFFGLFDITIIGKNLTLKNDFASLHELGAFLLIALVLLHLLGGLFHHFVLKDNLLKRLF